jgi:hypothetical protein
LDAYLKHPSDRGGKLVRVFLAVDDPAAGVLVIRGVTKVDLADLKSGPDMKRGIFLSRRRLATAMGDIPRISAFSLVASHQISPFMLLL